MKVMMIKPARKLPLLCLVASWIAASSFAAGGEEGYGSSNGLRGNGGFAAEEELLMRESENEHRLLAKNRPPKEASQRGSSSAAAGGDLSSVSSSSSSFETGCIRADNRTYNLTADEANNGRWMNEARASSGLRSLRYASDLVVEAKRWAQYLASRRTVRTRDYLNRNLFCGISDELGEYVISSRSVNKTGAFTSMMNGGGREYILYAPYDRFGIGISRNGSFFYMVTLFRNRA